MAKEQRAQKEIESDYKKLKKLAKTATSIKQLEEESGLSYGKIKTAFSKHPTVFKRMKEQLRLNREQAKLEAQEAKLEEKIKPEKKEVTKPKQKADFSRFVIDASIAGTENLKETLSKICFAKAKVILTSVTMKELEKMQKFKDREGLDARYILALAVENEDSFEVVLIDETLETPDDCIVQYCVENKEKVTLLTSDKTMVLKARMYAVQVQYFKKSQKPLNQVSSKIRTLYLANRVGNQLLISNFQTDKMSVCIRSGVSEYKDGVRELKVGDDVLIATQKIGYLTFAHYRIVSLCEENNCELIYSRRFYKDSELNLTNPVYKSFMEEFKSKHNL